ncbi:MAG TPA: SIMPL domain-containing protein [Pyrinomonadaceae bacterium]|nr:SIMPL domain-containing protein [Pyrinomonadaceae bacterium]
MSKSVLLLIILFGYAAHAQAQDPPDRPLITVSGQGEVLVVPDEVVFNLSATTVDKDLALAQRKTDEVVRNVIALARRFQVPATQIQTGHISLEERFSDEEATRRPRVFIGYAVTKSIAIILRDVSRAEDLLGELFRTGITRISSVDFRTTQDRKYRDQARAMAMKSAQEKARAMALEIGQGIGKAFKIVEEGPILRGSMANMSGFSADSGFADSSSAIALGQISITARVSVSFELK